MGVIILITSIFLYIFGKKTDIMTNFECLKEIIGITKDFCQCLHGQITQEEFEKLKISKSGLYLDNVEGGLFLRNIVQLDKCKDFLEVQKEAVETAKKFYQTDLLAELNLKYQVRKNNYIGEIGGTYTASMTTSKRLQFLKIKTLEDGVLHVDYFRIFVNTNATTKIWIMQVEEGKNEGNVIYEEENANSQTNYFSFEFKEPLKLPLNVNGKKQNYYFIWERLGEVQPRDIKTTCGCSGGDGFSNYISVFGGEAGNFSEIISAPNDVFTHGITLGIQLKCETGSVVCKEYDANDAIASVTAFAILYKSAELVIENIMNSTEVNRYTLISREQLWGKRSHFKSEYEKRIKYLAQNIDVSSSGCFICRDNTIYLGKILN